MLFYSILWIISSKQCIDINLHFYAPGKSHKILINNFFMNVQYVCILYNVYKIMLDKISYIILFYLFFVMFWINLFLKCVRSQTCVLYLYDNNKIYFFLRQIKIRSNIIPLLLLDPLLCNLCTFKVISDSYTYFMKIPSWTLTKGCILNKVDFDLFPKILKHWFFLHKTKIFQLQERYKKIVIQTWLVWLIMSLQYYPTPLPYYPISSAFPS